MGKFTINGDYFHSYVGLPEGNYQPLGFNHQGGHGKTENRAPQSQKTLISR